MRRFYSTLILAGAIYLLHRRGQGALAVALGAVLLAAAAIFALNLFGVAPALAAPQAGAPARGAPSLPELLGSGLRAGLLTFGGAYTAIPILQRDAVATGGWMTTGQFLDGLALSGILPAPFIIFATFVGYLGGGLPGALAVTLGVFAPAFAFTLVGHDLLERLIERASIHAFLDGITAGVVGLIAATTLRLLGTAIPDAPAAAIFALALLALYRWKAKAAVAGVMLGAGALGLLLFRV